MELRHKALVCCSCCFEARGRNGLVLQQKAIHEMQGGMGIPPLKKACLHGSFDDKEGRLGPLDRRARAEPTGNGNGSEAEAGSRIVPVPPPGAGLRGAHGVPEAQGAAGSSLRPKRVAVTRKLYMRSFMHSWRGRV